MIVARLDTGLSARVVGSFRLDHPAAGVRAGSALVRVGGRLLAVQDDAFTAVWIDPATRGLERLVLHGEGAPLTKPEKPDFEAALVAPNGAVYILGSGSASRRRWIARLDVASGSVALIDAGLLYDAAAEALGTTPNIEGATAMPTGDIVTLLHRGSGREPYANATLDVSLTALDSGREPVRILAVRRYDLGAVAGVPLTFTDAVPLGGGRMLYLAVAEDTPDAIADGPVVGGAVGVIGPGEARWTPLVLESGAPFAGKAEGIALDADGRSGFLLTDPDDPLTPAELCRVALDGFL